VDASGPKRSTRFWGVEQDLDAPAQGGAGEGVAGVDGSRGLVSLYFFFSFILFLFYFYVIFPPLSHESANPSLQNSKNTGIFFLSTLLFFSVVRVCFSFDSPPPSFSSFRIRLGYTAATATGHRI
jgi:hypothetical protein